MNQSFDIFFVVAEGDIHWVESATSMEAAKVRIDELGFRLPGKYMILEKPDGKRTIIVTKMKPQEPHH